MNFISYYEKGQAGENKGLSLGKGLENIHVKINGLQRKRIYSIAAAPKVGKSTFVDYGFLIQPYLYCIKHHIPVEWIYYSLEIDRISKEFFFATYFLYNDYNLKEIKIDSKKNGKDIIPISADYLAGRIFDDNDKLIKVDNSVFELLQKVYKTRIIPLFGEYDYQTGKQKKKGLITFIEYSDTPSGIFSYLQKHVKRNGDLIKNEEGEITGYKPRDPLKYTIVITDHMRKILPEKGMDLKKTVDMMMRNHVRLRNITNYTFVNIIHINRNMTAIDRMKFAHDVLFPQSDDIKDTGNISEDADYVFTMMNPNDTRYNLSKHFGLPLIKDGKRLHPNLRSIHLVESRHCEYPQHFRTNMLGNCKSFEQLKETK